MISVKAIRERKQIPVADMVDEIKTLYPRYDRYLQSKVENGDSYGIRLNPDAMNLIKKKFAPESFYNHINNENRKRPNLLQCRLDDDEWNKAMQDMENKGYKTMQAYMHDIIINHLKTVSKCKGDIK